MEALPTVAKLIYSYRPFMDMRIFGWDGLINKDCRFQSHKPD